MFFVIAEMPSKTFIMVLKKLPDHFNEIAGNKQTTHMLYKRKLKKILIGYDIREVII